MNTKIIGSRVIRLRQTASTNVYAIEQLAVNRPPEGSIIVTGNQTSGKGMGLNNWESEPGMNLTFSIILYPDFLPVERQFSFNQAISLGLSDLVKRKISNHRVTIKWPNDIYISNKKVCGILIQNSILGNIFDHMVTGIGLNVNQTLFRSPAPNPISFCMVTKEQYNLDILLEEVCKTIDERYLQLKSGGWSAINDEYLQRLYQLGEWHQYTIRGTEYKARITGIGNFGHLQLENESGKRWTCDSKEVQYL